METEEINFLIGNTNDGNRLIPLYGAYLGYSIPSGCSITPDYGVPYSQVLTESGLSVFTIGAIRVQAEYYLGGPSKTINEQLQVQNSIVAYNRNVYGDIIQTAIPVRTEISEYQEHLIVSKTTTDIDITGDVALFFYLRPHTYVTFTIYVKKRIVLPKLEVKNFNIDSPGLRQLRVKGKQLVK